MLGISRDLGDPGGEVRAFNKRRTLYRVSADHAAGRGCHRQTPDLARTIGSPWDEVRTSAGLGRCALAVGQASQAPGLLRQALEIFQRIGTVEAGEVARELTTLTEAGSPV